MDATKSKPPIPDLDTRITNKLEAFKDYVRTYVDGHEPGDRTIAFYAGLIARASGTYPGYRLFVALLVMVAKASYYVVLAFMLGTIGYWLLDRDPPLEIISREPVRMEVRAGEQLLIRTKRKRLRDCELTPDSNLIDGIQRKHDYVTAGPMRYGPAEPDKVIDTTDGPWIPRYAAPGPSTFNATWQYDCNPLQRFLRFSIPVYAKPVHFIILPPEPGGANGPTDYPPAPGRNGPAPRLIIPGAVTLPWPW